MIFLIELVNEILKLGLKFSYIFISFLAIKVLLKSNKKGER